MGAVAVQRLAAGHEIAPPDLGEHLGGELLGLRLGQPGAIGKVNLLDVQIDVGNRGIGTDDEFTWIDQGRPS